MTGALLDAAADALGTPEPALRLLVVLLLNMPLAFIFNVCFANHAPTVKVVAGVLVLFEFTVGSICTSPSLVFL